MTYYDLDKSNKTNKFWKQFFKDINFFSTGMPHSDNTESRKGHEDEGQKSQLEKVIVLSSDRWDGHWPHLTPTGEPVFVQLQLNFI